MKWPNDNINEGLKQKLNPSYLNLNIELNKEQENCYNFLIKWAENSNNFPKHVVIHGAAGGGKSAILKKFMSIYKGKVLVCA